MTSNPWYPRHRLPLLLLAVLLGGINCASDQLYEPAVDLCRCKADEICVNETCVVPGGLVLPDSQNQSSSCESVEVRINELRYAGVASTDFIELRAAPGSQIRGFRLFAYDADGARALDFALNADFDEAGLWLAAMGTGLEVTPAAVLGLTGFASPSGNVLLFDCRGTLLDALAYGSFESTQRFAGEGSAAPSTGADQSLGRCPTADFLDSDSDDNAADFSVDAASPGAANARLEGTPKCSGCDPSVHLERVWLDEVYYDPTGADEQASAFVELRGEAALSLDGLELESWDEPSRSWLPVVSLSSALSNEGLLLLAEDASLPTPHLLVPQIDGPNDAGGYRLLSCGQVVDLMLYGAVSDPTVAGGVVDELAVDVPEGRSLSRCPSTRSGLFVETEPTPAAPSVCPD